MSEDSLQASRSEVLPPLPSEAAAPDGVVTFPQEPLALDQSSAGTPAYDHIDFSTVDFDMPFGPLYFTNSCASELESPCHLETNIVGADFVFCPQQGRVDDMPLDAQF